LKHLNPDERSTAALIKIALKEGLGLDSGDIRRSTPGITIRRGDLYDLIEEGGFDPIIYLQEASRDIRGIESEIEEWLDKDPLFVLGDHTGLNRADEKLLDDLGASRISVGPRVLHADHCIILLLNEIDRVALKFREKA
ncbi:MAG: tRNA (pseudouridine(54)-N(1))-methyltransferase TrmY, partial [Candidatus Syntropharchaeales archaeon]